MTELRLARAARALGMQPEQLEYRARIGQAPFTETEGGQHLFNPRIVRAALELQGIKTGYADTPRMKAQQRARQAAFAALARKYPAEYQRFYEMEMAHQGEPVYLPVTRPCTGCEGMVVKVQAAGPWPKLCDTCDPRAARHRKASREWKQRKDKERLMAARGR